MKRFMLLFVLSAVLLRPAFAESQKGRDPHKLFYEANAYYEKQDYAKAVETYIKILDMGFESGNLYYNIGNSFFKLDKIGYAVLYYERAKILIPGDKDLKSNLEYVRSLVEDGSFYETTQNLLVKIIKTPFSGIDLNILAIAVFILYILLVIFLLFKITNPTTAKKAAALYLIILAAFLFSLAAIVMRYYDEEVLKYGIVIQEEDECKYEPIEKATTYYKVYEGERVELLQTRNGWQKIRRADGKIGWIKKGTLEEI